MGSTYIGICPDCGDRHMGRCGGLSFRERVASIRLDPSAVSSRTLRRYYDRESLDEMFGTTESERREQYMDETKGRGALHDPASATPDELEFFLDGPETDDV